MKNKSNWKQKFNKNFKKTQNLFNKKKVGNYINLKQFKNFFKVISSLILFIFLAPFNSVKNFFLQDFDDVNLKLKSKNYEFLSEGAEWRVYLNPKTNSIIKVSTGNLPDMNSEHRLEELKKNYELIKKIFPKKFIHKTIFKRKGGLNFAYQDKIDSPISGNFLLNKENIQKADPRLKENFKEFLAYYIKFVEEKEKLKKEDNLEINFDIHIFNNFLNNLDRSQVSTKFKDFLDSITVGESFFQNDFEISNIIIDKNYRPVIMDFGSPENIQYLDLADDYFNTANIQNAKRIIEELLS